MVTFSYHAQEQIKRLSLREQSELTRVLEDDDKLNQKRRLDMTGKFVSKFGDDKRVVWQKSGDGNVVVLTVVSKLT